MGREKLIAMINNKHTIVLAQVMGGLLQKGNFMDGCFM